MSDMIKRDIKFENDPNFMELYRVWTSAVSELREEVLNTAGFADKLREVRIARQAMEAYKKSKAQ